MVDSRLLIATSCLVTDDRCLNLLFALRSWGGGISTDIVSPEIVPRALALKCGLEAEQIVYLVLNGRGHKAHA